MSFRKQVNTVESAHYALIREEMPHREFYWPRLYYRLMATGDPEKVRRRWKPVAWATLVLEISGGLSDLPPILPWWGDR
ncbi:hypothetical protein ACFV3E_41515 [Streptomyces sp. NPDC059718]